MRGQSKAFHGTILCDLLISEILPRVNAQSKDSAGSDLPTVERKKDLAKNVQDDASSFSLAVLFPVLLVPPPLFFFLVGVPFPFPLPQEHKYSNYIQCPLIPSILLLPIDQILLIIIHPLTHSFPFLYLISEFLPLFLT